MFFLRSQVLAPKHADNLKNVLTKLLALAERIDFVCDTYTSLSIKDVERNIRGSHYDRFMFQITGAEQIFPKEFQETMKSCNFKS